MTILRTALVGFAAGALSVLVFHQGTVALLHLAGLVANAPFPMRPVPPLGIPQLANLAFWGGVWGIVIAAILAARPAWPMPCSATTGPMHLPELTKTVACLRAPRRCARRGRWSGRGGALRSRIAQARDPLLGALRLRAGRVCGLGTRQRLVPLTWRATCRPVPAPAKAALP